MVGICQEQIQDQARDVEQADKLTKSEGKVFPETQKKKQVGNRQR